MSFAHKAGSFVGKSAAYAWEGSKLGATQFGQGAREAYIAKAEDLRAKRLAITAANRPAQRVQPVAMPVEIVSR